MPVFIMTAIRSLNNKNDARHYRAPQVMCHSLLSVKNLEKIMHDLLPAGRLSTAP